MNCFAECKLPHPIDLLRLGGDKNWKRLGEKMLEYRTNLDKNRRVKRNELIRVFNNDNDDDNDNNDG